MLTGIIALAAGYLGAEGAAFTIAKLFGKPAGKLAVKAHESGEYHRDLYWALSKIDNKKLSKRDKGKYNKMMGSYFSDAFTMDLRSGT